MVARCKRLRQISLAEAKKSRLVITPASGEKTEKLVDEILSISPEIKQSLVFLVRKKGELELGTEFACEISLALFVSARNKLKT